MKSVKVKFQNARNIELSGQIDFPVTGQPAAYVLFAHCFTCSKNLIAVDNISRALTQHDLAVLRFDFTGLGQSDGDFPETNFSTNLEDLEKAYEFLEKEYDAPRILVGHSLGGVAVLHVGGRMKAIQAVVTIGSPSDSSHVKKVLTGSMKEIKKQGNAEVNIGGRNFTIQKQFIDDLDEHDTGDMIKNLDKALLIMHSPQDKIVGINNAADIYDAAMHPKSFISLDGSDHLLSKEADSLYAGSIIGPWASRYIDTVSDPVAPEGEVWTRIGSEGFVTEVIAGKHHLIGDEPKESGGTDLGPSPYGYLLSALGTCTAMTLRMYANYKKLDLHEVNVKLTHEKIHSVDGEAVEGKIGKIDQITRLIQLEGNLSDEERKKLIEIADRCPVHKTIEGKPEIITKEIKSF